jgi:hypothetical protein
LEQTSAVQEPTTDAARTTNRSSITHNTAFAGKGIEWICTCGIRVDDRGESKRQRSGSQLVPRIVRPRVSDVLLTVRSTISLFFNQGKVSSHSTLSSCFKSPDVETSYKFQLCRMGHQIEMCKVFVQGFVRSSLSAGTVNPRDSVQTEFCQTCLHAGCRDSLSEADSCSFCFSFGCYAADRL